MARSRGFVPNFDRLGLRITPSDVIAPSVTPDDCYHSLLPDDSDLPGSDTTLSDTITWNTTARPTTEADRSNSIVVSVDWMIPLTPTEQAR